MQERKYIPIDEMKKTFIFINGNFYWKSDDIEVLKKAGWISPDGRKYLHFKGQNYMAHRVAWAFHYGQQPDEDIDHIDGNPSNNQLNNLRSVKHIHNQQNLRKARKDNKTGYLGVAIHKASGKFSAQIWVNKKKKHLGLFKTAEEAHKAYLDAKRKYHVGCTI